MSTIVVNKQYRDRQKRKDAVISAFIGVFALLWLLPLVWTLYSSLRPYNDLESYGVFSFPHTLNLENYFNAIRRMNIPLYFMNTAIITLPAVFLTLFLEETQPSKDYSTLIE